ncbi:CMP/dCMP deaminase, zinc-binding [Sulfurimonas gotlandica GD1]|uniref:CMP/dCMP deaminase, zinc-binding n=1 Tax=Sulfurimonas gotlandica (strain DSM 19862 / JCM 16533 / GD1) TaxID=929558 RepID=B6BP17_SULGG|nr:nucleoside deaminase [Sulfurimonas gotlandica]EDZ61134.1 guanine deaminase [Sulfurimonas gotlandica GD1]EHP30905.1 CMP/dCMP deaminase, zinc-binding [Sulfurimonas gotlandica GD1]
MNKWMKIAYDEATEGMLANDGGPFGAVIVKDDKIISQAHNQVLKSNDPTAHAEVNAIRKASEVLETFDLSGCVLYTSCMPCPMCLGAIFWARIETVYYSATEEDAARGGFDDKRFYEMLDGKNSALNLKRIDAENSTKLFDLWLEKNDREIY